MRCRVCRAGAVIEIRRHNAAFCPEHFLSHCAEQVARTIKKFWMFGPEAGVLVAVSGGKDSLMLWDVLSRAGYSTTGVYLGLGIGDYSEGSRQTCERFAEDRGLDLRVVDLRTEYGFDIPGGAAAARRPTCATCGLSKRYVLNDVAVRGGFDVLATGHNLDDEAAVLYGNLMHWDVEALGRQSPVLPAAAGFVSRVKPLVRLAERETAAYCVLRGIEYVVDECPMVAGNTQLRYKESLNELESRSPGSKQQLYFGFLERARHRFEPAGPDEHPQVHPCAECGAPTTGEVCAFCRLRNRATDPERVEVAISGTRGRSHRRRRR